MSQAEIRHRCRYRITFGKQGVLRYTSHLDLARTWERALRRAGAPLIYSQGFNPRPQIQLAAALPLGWASTAEILDIYLEADDIPSPQELRARVEDTVPEGLIVYRIAEVTYGAPALQTQRSAATYRVVPGGLHPQEDLQARVESLLAQPEIIRQRRQKTYNLRPLIVSIEVFAEPETGLEIRLVSSQEEGTGRPDEVLEALELDPLAADITRTNMTFEEEDGPWRSSEEQQ